MSQASTGYRERLRQVQQQAFDQYEIDHPDPDLAHAKTGPEWVLEWDRTAAEAVAAQVLRDCIAWLKGYGTAPQLAIHWIREYAEDHSIDLGETT